MLTNALLLLSAKKKQDLVTVKLIGAFPEDMPSVSRVCAVYFAYTNDEGETKSVFPIFDKGYSFPVGKVIRIGTNFNPAEYKINQLIYESSSGTIDVLAASSFTMDAGRSYLKVEIVRR